MEITYFGHSTFRLKGKNGTVVTDPYASSIGLSLPALSADIVTISHQHDDHNSTKQIKGTARRAEPFVVAFPGEYEVGGISLFGIPSFHDDAKGAERGPNTIFLIIIDDIRICHLGDLGHDLTASQLEEIGVADVLLCPVGGHFTIDPKRAVNVIQQIEPSYVLPMHYRTDKHTAMFSEVQPVDSFLKEYGVQSVPQPKVVVDKLKLPEETELVVLEISS